MSESIDCGLNDELMDASSFGGGGVIDFRGVGETGREDGEVGRGDGVGSTIFGDCGRTIGSGFVEEKPDVVGSWTFNGGGGIMPLL